MSLNVTDLSPVVLNSEISDQVEMAVLDLWQGCMSISSMATFKGCAFKGYLVMILYNMLNEELNLAC